MNIRLIRDYVITPALIAIDAYSDEALDMILFTGAVESRYEHVRQVNGPALSWFQIEPRTHDDIWSNFLGYTGRQHLIDGLLDLSSKTTIGVARTMEVNPWYAAAMCRIHYMRDRQKLPEVGNRQAQAEYWKRVYNTKHGKGTIGKARELAFEVLGD